MWWNILMFNSFGGLKVWFFRQNIFFANDHYIRQYNELRRRFMTLGDVGRKKYFIGVLFHFGQKMRLGLGSMTFQTFCIFRTGYPPPLWNIYLHGVLYWNGFFWGAPVTIQNRPFTKALLVSQFSTYLNVHFKIKDLHAFNWIFCLW